MQARLDRVMELAARHVARRSSRRSFLGTFAMVLALSGLYGVLSDLVARRTREIGIRLAMGASRARLVRQLLTPLTAFHTAKECAFSIHGYLNIIEV